jgi:hypothetical protein
MADQFVVYFLKSNSSREKVRKPVSTRILAGEMETWRIRNTETSARDLEGNY